MGLWNNRYFQIFTDDVVILRDKIIDVSDTVLINLNDKKNWHG